MIVVFDIDGVLADARHREHFVAQRPKDWDAFFAAVGEDGPLTEGLARLSELSADHDVVLLSGRPERTRADTERWLADHGVSNVRVVLRADADRRPAATFKAEAIRRVGSPEEIALVVDDDEAIVKTLTGLGYHAEQFR